MKEHDINGAVVLTFESFDRTNKACHCFTTKIGGPACAWFAPEDVVAPVQVHETAVHVATERDRGGNSRLEGVDGLVTNVKNLALSTAHADCVPLFFLDPVAEAAGLAHAGWRGTVSGIGARVVRVMADTYGCQPKNILAGVGPSIGRCCFEVHEPVARQFFSALPYAGDYVTLSASVHGKYNIDLWGINRRILMEAGVPGENIEIGGLCTKCDPRLFHSYRRNPMEKGRMRAYMALS